MVGRTQNRSCALFADTVNPSLRTETGKKGSAILTLGRSCGTGEMRFSSLVTRYISVSALGAAWYGGCGTAAAFLSLVMSLADVVVSDCR